MSTNRIAKWKANPLPVKLPPSLQAAKDAAKRSAAADAKPKHPGPWKYYDREFVNDAKGNVIASVHSADPETRTILLRAGEMFAALRELSDKKHDSPAGLVSPAGMVAYANCLKLHDKIEAEIAGKGTP